MERGSAPGRVKEVQLKGVKRSPSKCVCVGGTSLHPLFILVTLSVSS